MYAKNCLGRQGLAQKASQTFFDNISVQQNIVESINNRFLDFQQLAKVLISPYSCYSYSYDFLVLTGYSKIEKISCA